MDDALRRFVEEVTGGRLLTASRPDGGGSREMYLIEVEGAIDCPSALVLRCESGSAFTGTEISPAHEAVVYEALADTAVPVPRVVGVAPGGAALLMERLPGSGDLATAPEDNRHAVLGSFVDALAALHDLDVTDLDLPGFRRPATPEDHARLDLAMWGDLARDGISEIDPLLLYAGAWLTDRAPRDVPRTVLVQGDTGPGNFVFDGTSVTGLVDWEFAHIGDPMDDWAWIEMRNRGPLAPDLVQRYTTATGIEHDDARVDYYRCAVDYRCAITTSLAVSKGGGARGWAPYLLVTQRYLADLARRLSELAGVTEHVPAPPLDPTPLTDLYDVLLDGVRSAVRAIEDTEAREATRNLQILVHHLRAHDQVGREVAALDHDDRRETFGHELDAETFEQLVTEAGAGGDETVLRYLLRRAGRRRALWATLLERPRR